MQLLLHLPNELAERFKQAVPVRQRSGFITKLLEQALPAETDPLYLAALAAEQDKALGAEMRAWREGLIGDGSYGCEAVEAAPDATR